jgi:predicted ATPase/DNA-binding winged helix-turn-helix (wHTH) protein
LGDQIAFERFVLSRIERRLTSGGVPVAISAAGFRMLLALVDEAGKVVTKDALMRSVWGSSPITENALHVQVAAVRKIIGNHLIITQSGIGYRFAGQLRKSSAAGTTLSGSEKGRRTSNGSRATPGPARHLLGREQKLRDLAKSLSRDRFVTLTGPGGVGKTSLARAFAHMARSEFPDGIWFVELAALRDQAGVADTLKAALGVEGGFDASPLDDVLARLTSKRCLLVLDNCEHLLPALATMVQALHEGAPYLAILATSRQALCCAGEHVEIVPPLALPDTAQGVGRAARRAPAFRLFVERITAGDPHFTVHDDQVAVASRICCSLDGLPLALEIVAGWASVLGLETLEEKLNTAPFSWAHARTTATSRHYDLRAALGWSFDLLSASEQALLRRLSVFAQDFSLNAAEDVAAGGGVAQDAVFTDLAGLVAKSLVTMVHGTRPPLYRLLETTRAFALAKLRDHNEEETFRHRHARYVLALLTVAERAWDTTRGDIWLARYARLIPEIRACVDWAFGARGDIEAGIAIAAASWPLWRELSLRVEGARHLERALALIGPQTPAQVAGQLRQGLGMMICDNQADKARPLLEDAARIMRQFGDRKRLAEVMLILAFSRFLLADIKGAERDLAEGRHMLAGIDSQRWLAAALALDSLLHMHHRRFADAREAGRKAALLYEAIGATRSALASRSNMVEFALCNDDVPVAIEEGRLLAAHLRKTDHQVVLSFLLVSLVAGLVRAERFAEALETADEAARLLPGHRPLFVLMDHMALRCALLGQLENAAMLAGFTDASYRARDWPRQDVERMASEHLGTLLEKKFSSRTLDALKRDGALLSETGAWALAVRHDEPAERILLHAAD